MFKRYVVAAVASSLISFTPAAVATSAADYAAGLQSLVGKKFEGDLTIFAIATEGNTVVITIDGPAGWRNELTADQVSDALMSGLCSEASGFFDGGITARVDSVELGKKLRKGPVETSCPK